MAPAAPKWAQLKSLIAIGTGPFARLARAHCFHAAGDATVAIALAGSLFFSIDPGAARSRILLYLVCTLAPFALVGPLIGPAIDRFRGGHRLVILTTMAARAVLMLLMIPYIDSGWLFPIAFTHLVLGKSYSVAKAATVPSTVGSDEELVEKNSRLAVLSAFAGAVGAAPAVVLQTFASSGVILGYAFFIYVLGAVWAYAIDSVAVVEDEPLRAETAQLRSWGVRLAASAMSTLRGIGGFMFFVLAFAVREGQTSDLSGVGTAVGASVKVSLGFSLGSEPAWKLGLPMALWGLGILIGNTFAPRVRKRLSEEHMILAAVTSVGAAALAAAWAGGLQGASLLALVTGCAPAAAKLAFDALVQRDAPGANYGAAFGRFETRFQVGWVIGALLAVVVPIPLRIGFLIVVVVSALAAAALFAGSKRSGPAQDQPIKTGLGLRRTSRV